MITSGEGKYKVFLEEKKIGDDLVYILGGGFSCDWVPDWP